MSEYTEGLRDRLARALFIEGVGADSAAAWDAPGDGGRQRWWNYADAVLAEIAEHDRIVAERAWDEGREALALDVTRPLGEDGLRPVTRNPYRKEQENTNA